MRRTADSPVDPNEIGRLFVLSYSGGILFEDGIRQQRVKYGGYEYYIEPPARVALPTWRPIPQLTPESFAQLFPGVNVPPVLRLAVIPNVTDLGVPGLQQVWGDNPVPAGLPKDTFVVMAFGKNPGSSAVPLGSLISLLFRWVRMISGQWWAGRPTEQLTGNTHLEVGIFPQNVIRDFPAATGKGSYAGGFSRLNASQWESACQAVERDMGLDPSKEFISDATYSYFVGDYFTFFIRVCSFVEIRADEWMKNARLTSAALRITDTDILKKISVGTGAGAGRDLSKDHPDVFAFLKACWIARNNLAHGKPLHWIYKGQRAEFAKFSTEKLFFNLNALANWTDDLLRSADAKAPRGKG